MRLSRTVLSVLAAWLIASAGLAQLGNPDAAIRLPAAPKNLGPRGQGPNVFGTTQIVFTRIGATEFAPLQSANTYSDDGVSAIVVRRFATGGSGIFAATVHLPAGATPAYLEFDYCDTNAALSPSLFFYDCSFNGDCSVNPPVIITATLSVGCSSESADLTPLAITADNFNREILLVASMGALDNTNSFAGAILGYYLQVSPAPAVATFTDVPTSHPQFQFIEALVASGITAGCGGGNYCPAATLTRGQMAVFLSKALGLQFN